MELTRELNTIINSREDLIVKTRGIFETNQLLTTYAHQNKNSKVLYVAANEADRNKASLQISTHKISNLRVETLFSLAWKRVGHKRLRVKQGGYSPLEIIDILQLHTSDILFDYKIALLTERLVRFHCNYPGNNISLSDFSRTIFQSKELAFFWKNELILRKLTNKMLELMSSCKIPSIPSYCIKIFLSSHPEIKADVVIINQAQDLKPTFLAYLKQLKKHKILIGDENLQLIKNSFRVNALSRLPYKQVLINYSTQLNQEVAKTATQVLDFKKHLFENFVSAEIQGLRNETKNESHGIISKSHSRILTAMIEEINHPEISNSFSCEGSLDQYLFTTDGIKLMDIHALYLGEKNRITNHLFKKIDTFERLEEIAHEVNTFDYHGMIEIVRKYGKSLPGFIKEINKKINSGNLENNVSFTSIHLAKSYNSVTLLDDFIDLFKISDKSSTELNANYSEIETEINLVYAATVKAHNIINHNYGSLNTIEEGDKNQESVFKLPSLNILESDEKVSRNEKIYNLKRKKDIYQNTYTRWTDIEDMKLKQLYQQNQNIENLAKLFKRTPVAVIYRLKKLDIY